MRPILIADSRALSTPSSCATKFSCTGGMFFFYAKEVIFIRELLIDLGFIIDAAQQNWPQDFGLRFRRTA